jgi:long-chain acyl-CoA synthetase
VEAAIYSCPEVTEAAVFGEPDERLGEVPVAVVHAVDGFDEGRLRAFLEDRLAAFKIPERIVISGEPLPRLGTGKIDKVALKSKHA